MIAPARPGARVTPLGTPQHIVPPTKYNGVPPLFAGLVVLAFLVPASANAQAVRGPWEDATIAPRGALRAEISTIWTQARERYGRTGDLESLGARFSTDSLGPRWLEPLGGVGAGLSTLLGVPVPPLSLGTLDTQAEASAYVTPITLEYGVTSRLELRAVIPYVKNRVEIYPKPNLGAFTGNLGVNPAYLVTEARTRNELVVTELQGAAAALQTALTDCQGSTSPSCTAINADRAGATALTVNATNAAGVIQSVYGSATGAGALAVPLAGSGLQTAVEGRLADLSTQFTTFLGAAPAGQWIGARPVPGAPLGYDGLQRLLSDTAGGILARELADVERSHLGDVELAAKYVLVDSYRHEVGQPLPDGGGMRFAVAGVFRLPTAQLDSPDDFADIGTGDGQADIEARAFLDVIASRRWWASAVLRYGVQQSDELTVRIPRTVDDPFPAFVRRVEVTRDLGDFLEIELAPRFAPNEALSLSANYRYRQKGADRYRGDLPVVPADINPAVLAEGTKQSEHRLGYALTYSTVRGYAQRQSRWPLEVALLHTRVIGGEGVYRQSATAVAVRLYRRIAGPNLIRPAAR